MTFAKVLVMGISNCWRGCDTVDRKDRDYTLLGCSRGNLIATDKLSQKPATQGFEPILIAHDRRVSALIQITKEAG
ncbi:hypothetical protein C1896_15540 [Pseudomonadaceae bacterium SI-3]|nr:hypothetical protein C1896_15540 [Pseudomonadaceae bacterium SI-3]